MALNVWAQHPDTMIGLPIPEYTFLCRIIEKKID